MEKVDELSKVERQWRAELFAKLKGADEPTGVMIQMVCAFPSAQTNGAHSSANVPKRIQKTTRGVVADMEGMP